MHQIDTVETQNIPTQLMAKNQWVTWQAGDIDLNGKFAKYPVNPSHDFKVDAHNRNNQLSYLDAIKATSNAHVSGIGFVLNGEPFSANDDGEILYLIGIDIDHKAGLSALELKAIWEALNKPYVEISPSKQGIRMFCLSKRPLGNRNQDGLEIYCSGRFLTITGWSGRGVISDCTEAIHTLHQKWFPPKQAGSTTRNNLYGQYQRPETSRNRAWVEEMLSFIDANCSYEMYRNIIWAIESTGWSCAEEIERAWSLTAPDRFTEDGLTIIRSSFDYRERGITIGTLVHLAKAFGYGLPKPTVTKAQGEAV